MGAKKKGGESQSKKLRPRYTGAAVFLVVEEKIQDQRR